MQQLQFVELDEGGRLVLTGDDGTQYAVVVDDRLRAALRPRPRRSEDGRPAGRSVSPRDVQAMIRAGQPAEDVAASTGWELDRVRRFEGPVLAEREHVVGLAQRAPVRASGRTDGSHTLDRRVRERLQSRGVDLTAVTWDAARGEAHEPWTVIVAFGAGGRERRAAWHYDVRSRSVEALDDEARWLSEDEQSLPGGLAGHPLLGGHHGEDEAAADLMATMRERRQRRGRGRRTPTRQTSEDPSHVPGRQEMPDEVLPLEDLPYDPDTMGDPPAAHPRGSAPEAAAPVGPDEDDEHHDEPPSSQDRGQDAGDDGEDVDADPAPGGARESAPVAATPEPEVAEPMSPEEAQRAVGRSPGRKRRRLRLPSLGGDHAGESQEPEGSFARTRHDPQEVTFDEFFGVDDEDEEGTFEPSERHEVRAPSEADDVREQKPPTLVAVEDPAAEDDIAAEGEAWDDEAADDDVQDEDVQDDLPPADAHAADDEAGAEIEDAEAEDSEAEPEADAADDGDAVEADADAATDDLPPGRAEDVEDIEDVDDEPAEKPAAKPAGRKGRTSVPSWDDIMFGSRPPRG